MKRILAMAVLAVAMAGPARAQTPVPFVAHRAAYMITLLRGSGVQAPVAASGLIAYEFRGSACEGYASDFRQVTQLQRNEGEPNSSDTRAVTFEDGAAKTLRFMISSTISGAPQPSINGNATRGAGGAVTVTLKEPKHDTRGLGGDVLFPTQHIAHIIAAAKSGANTLEARVFDGSDTGEKVFDTFTVIGAAETGPSADTDKATALKSVRRWPVTISYFDMAKKDSSPEYTLTFDLYENGVSGSLKLNYGAFTLGATLTKFELLPSAPCAK